jgi:hypothetical protein
VARYSQRGGWLDDLDLVLALQLARQAQADLAAAGQHHAAHRPVAWRSAPSTVRMCSVAASTKTSSPGSMRVLPSSVGRPCPGGRWRRCASRPRHQLRDLGQAVLHQRPAGHRAHRDQADQPVRELQHLQRLGVLDQLADVGGDALLGADHLVDREAALAQQRAPFSNSGCACARWWWAR